ncbi:MAG: transcriptional repressor LexA [Candidatus Hatepunaea meridiana]|nr:transcriptional repressor LexA [Candidatus Hatepunaea meridiana]
MVNRRIIKPPTKRQQQVFDFIAEEMHIRGRPPTLREIGTHLSIGSTNAVRSLLTALERKGYVRRKAYLSRGIELLKTPHNVNLGGIVSVPIVGRVAAGQPLLAEENLEGNILIDKDLLRANDGFALKVKGQSMIEAGIRDGDIVVARPNQSVETGSIVVAVIGDEATVKYFYPERERIRLEPANAHFGPIIVEKNTPGFRIAGKVVGLYRKY